MLLLFKYLIASLTLYFWTLKSFLSTSLTIMLSLVLPSTIIFLNCSTTAWCSPLKSPSVSPILSSVSFTSSSPVPTSVYFVSPFTVLSHSLQSSPCNSCLFIISNSSSDKQPFFLIALACSRCSVDSNIPLSRHSVNILFLYSLLGFTSSSKTLLM